MKHTLAKYVGQTIGVNFEKPEKFDPLVLVSVDDDVLTLQTPGGRTLTYALKWVIFVLEGNATFGGGFGKKTSVPALVQVYNSWSTRGVAAESAWASRSETR